MRKARSGIPHTKCLNCDNATTGHYCAECGQKTSTSRLGLEDVVEDVAEVALHVTERLFFTIWEMIFRPGRSIQLYLDGKRKAFQGPVAYFAVGYFCFEMFLKYFFERWGMPSGTLSRMTRETLFAGMVAEGLLCHYIAVRPRKLLLETVVIFMYVYSTFFFLAVPMMILEMSLKNQLDAVPEQFRSLIVDISFLSVVVGYFVAVGRYMKIPLLRVGLAVLVGLGTFVVIRLSMGVS